MLETTEVTEVPTAPALSTSDIGRALRNDGVASFALTNERTGESRTFERKDLGYDEYIEFCELARPIIAAVSGAMDINSVGGEVQIGFNPIGLDYGELLKLAGKELPKMAWLCCHASDPKIKVDDIKRLGRRPLVLLEVVLAQIQHNQIVQEFADFFPRIAKALENLAPQASQAMTPVPATTE
jgi:hypothetical protein